MIKKTVFVLIVICIMKNIRETFWSVYIIIKLDIWFYNEIVKIVCALFVLMNFMFFMILIWH